MGKSSSPERRIPGVPLTRSHGNYSLNTAASHKERRKRRENKLIVLHALLHRSEKAIRIYGRDRLKWDQEIVRNIKTHYEVVKESGTVTTLTIYKITCWIENL